MKTHSTHRLLTSIALAILTGASAFADSHALLNNNKGSNFIAFTEQQGERSKNLVLSKLDLAMMDPTDRANMLASLEEQYGKPVAWASRAARSNAEQLVTYARDGEVERQGLRLRARKVISEGPMELSQAACIPHPGELLRPSPLLGVTRSDVLTWNVNQDHYMWGGNNNGNSFQYHSYNTYPNGGFNYGLDFGLPGWFTPMWYGFSIKTKLSADIAGRLDYQQWWYKVNGNNNELTRDVLGTATLGLRGRIEGIISWGHDWNFLGSHWGLGLEARGDVGLNLSASVTMNSSNTSNREDKLDVGFTPNVYLEAHGDVWIGNVTHKNADDDYHTEGHKLIHGAKGQVVFLGWVSAESTFVCKEWDWVNDKWNNNMNRWWKVISVSANGKAQVRGEIKFGSFVYQQGYTIWSDRKSSGQVAQHFSSRRNTGLDSLL